VNSSRFLSEARSVWVRASDARRRFFILVRGRSWTAIVLIMPQFLVGNQRVPFRLKNYENWRMVGDPPPHHPPDLSIEAKLLSAFPRR
jgi:hypothetical protein